MDNRTLVARVAAKLGRSRTDVGHLLEAMVGVATARLAEMDAVSVPGFGTLEPVKTDEHVSRDAAGRRMLVPPSVEVRFAPSNVLKGKLKRR